jgi:hypothetical protein
LARNVHIAPFDRGYYLAEDLAGALALAPCESGPLPPASPSVLVGAFVS